MWEQFLASLLVVAASEMGDKTQLLVLAFAAQCPLPVVISGVALGLLTTNLMAALLGTGIGMALPLAHIKLAAGVLFLAFAAWTLWGNSGESEEEKISGRLQSPLAIAGAFFMAELGDKTQLAALTLAARYQSFWPVWLGASAGMMLAIALAIGLGYFVGRKIPESALKWVSASIFGIFGVITILTALGGL
ncbi:MAG: TMEM165/GDT1 family protein [Firmicutes bacterium]|nr:TMEM165/GDT1 family protein [Bacillota bacterium]